MRTFAIADIHGCHDELTALVDKLKKEADLIPSEDTLVFLGDYVDRGPKSKQVVSQLIDWNNKYPHWQFLYGNHEDLMLDALVYKGRIYGSYDLWWNQGGRETAHSYFPEGMSKYDMAISQPMDHIIPEHLDWLRQRPIYWENEGYFFIHAGINPDLTLGVLKRNIDKDEVRHESIWIRDEFVDSDNNWGKKIVFGHTPQPNFEPLVMSNKIGLDTAVCPPRNGRLTAVELPIEKFYFVEAVDKFE